MADSHTSAVGPQQETPRPYVFVSYVRESGDLVNRLVEELRSAGIEVWIDHQSLQPGQLWQTEARQAIQGASFFLACFSEEFLGRDRSYMNKELGLAFEERQQRPKNRAWLIPILLSGPAIPDMDIGPGEVLGDLNVVDLRRDWEEGVSRLKSLLASPAAEARGIFRKPAPAPEGPGPAKPLPLPPPAHFRRTVLFAVAASLLLLSVLALYFWLRPQVSPAVGTPEGSQPSVPPLAAPSSEAPADSAPLKEVPSETPGETQGSRKVLGNRAEDGSKPEPAGPGLTVNGVHADCSQKGYCTIEMELENKGPKPARVTGFRFVVVEYRAIGTLGGPQAPDELGDVDLSAWQASSSEVVYAHRKAPVDLDGGEFRSLTVKVTARKLSKGFGLWTLRSALETTEGSKPLGDIQLMLPTWDARLLREPDQS